MKEIKFEYGFESVNGIVKKVYHLSEIPNIAKKCDVWNVLPIAYVRQFTGLKDKNGQEIYEGDILREPAKNKWEEVNYVGYEVFYHDNDCCDNHIGFQMNRTHFYGSVCGTSLMFRFIPKHTKQLEIIGNVHDSKA